jgi:hypothetical protein
VRRGRQVPRQLGSHGLVRRDAPPVGALQLTPLGGPDSLDVTADLMLGDGASCAQATLSEGFRGRAAARVEMIFQARLQAVPALGELW